MDDVRMLDESGVRFGIAVGGQVLAVLATAWSGAGPALLAAVVASVTVGRRLPPAYLLALGLTAWAFVTGFVVHQDGRLTFAASDLLRLAVVVATVLGVSRCRLGTWGRPTGFRPGAARSAVVGVGAGMRWASSAPRS